MPDEVPVDAVPRSDDRAEHEYQGPAAFTYDEYERFLSVLQDEGYRFLGYDASVDDHAVLLRHDVDWSPARAVRMARIEASHGIEATYLFLLTSPFYNALSADVRADIETIVSLGHDVGLHFSTHQYWSTEPQRAALERAVATELDTLSTVVDRPVETVSFHIPPSWVLGVDFEAFRSTYASRFFDDIPYRGDSNQRWRTEPPFADGVPDRLQVLVHPGLWAETDESFERRLEREQADRFETVRAFMQHQFVDDAVER